MQIITHAERAAGTVRQRVPARVRQIMIEKTRARYIPLECGHAASWDIDVLYEVFKPLGKLLHYCEKCKDWIKATDRDTKTEYPDEPMFLDKRRPCLPHQSAEQHNVG